MWGVEVFGWELFMETAVLKEKEFDDLLEKFKEVSVRYMTAWEASSVEQIICHDDLSDSRGPVFHPDWYRKHIFPRYKEIFYPFKSKGKKIIFCSDGNITPFLDDLLEAGVDGFMIETPATDFKNIINKCGKDKVIIGGVDTKILTFKTSEEIDVYVKEVISMARDCPGFFFSSPGGIHGGIPMENLEAYFNARWRYGKELHKKVRLRII
jgi:uroporphyrinogen decarboxylase